MEAGSALARTQLKCYGRRNRSKTPREEAPRRAAAKTEETGANGKIEDGNRLGIIQAGAVEAEEGQGSDHRGVVFPEVSEGASKEEACVKGVLPLGNHGLPGGISIESQENAGKVADVPPKLGFDNDRQQAEQGKEETCVQATEVLDESLLSTSQKEAMIFRNAEEQLAYEELILCQADDIFTKREALESVKRIPPKWKEPTHVKCHWDFVLEEMSWLAKDYEKERKWKLNQAKKVALKATKSRSEVEIKGLRRQKGEEQRIRRIASNIAKEVKKFWMKIEKLVIYKHQLVLEERKKKALDKHLDFLLGQTERYSSMLAENLSNLPTKASDQGQELSQFENKSTVKLLEKADSAEQQHPHHNVDEDFICEAQEEEDDEATIEADEALITEDERREELDALQRESDLPLEELVNLYAGEGYESQEKEDSISNGEGEDRDEPMGASDGSETSHLAMTGDADQEMDDGEYTPDSADGPDEDDERTFDEEERLVMAEGNDPKSELEQLRLESELPVAELLSRYHLEHSESAEHNEESQEDGTSEAETSRSVCSDGQVNLDNDDAMTCTTEAKERMGEPSTSGRSSFLIIRDDKSKIMAVENLTSNSSEQEAKVLANVARAAKQRGERMKRRALREESEQVCSLNARVEDSGTGGKELEDAAAAALSAQPTGYTFSTTRVRTKLPFLLKHSLREYQHIGLDWLVTMYEKRLNGILADEMGLGKTIMTIALLAHLACEKGIWGPHLIVVPTSVVLNWETEFMKWCPAFKVLTYFGNAKERKVKRQGWSKANSFHICITTYRLVIQDAKAFKRKKWKYLILDEAHLIKNWKSQRWQMLLNFNSKRRVLLTGTPLQNDLMELWSLMHFLMPHVFQSHQEFRDWFSNPISGMIEGQEKVNQDVVDRLHNVLRPFILRRLKQDVEKQLPKKYEHVIPCRLSKRQRNLYEDFMASSDTQATLSSGNFLGLINVLMQLRKVCNHPDLFEGRPIVSSFDMPGIELQFCSAVCAALQKRPFSGLNLEALNLLMTNHEFQMESWEVGELIELATPGTLIEEIASTGEDSWNENEHLKEPQGIFEEIQAALNAQRQIQKREKARQLAWLNILRCNKHLIYGRGLRRHVAVEHPVSDVHKIRSDPSRYLDFSSAISETVKLPPTWCESLMDLLRAFVFVIPAARAPSPVVWCSRPLSSGLALKPDFPSDHLVEFSQMMAPLRPIIVRRQLFFPDRRLLQFDCGKLQQLELLLRRLKSEGHRALIFTQMTKMLDILESFINLYGYTYMRLDGSTKPEQRQILMQRFNTNPKIFLFILSTRSGGVGINLVGADTVIFYDSDWNPAMDLQAQDRCHRIGQTREVHIYRLVSESTIEENILKKANQKRFLDDLVIQSGSYNTEFFKKLDPMELLSGVNKSGENTAQLAGSAKRAEHLLSSADVDAALRNAEDEADYMAMKKVEQEEAADNQEFTEDVSVDDDECADELDDGKASEVKVQTPTAKAESGNENALVPAGHEHEVATALNPVDAEEEMDMLADVRQLAAAAAAAGHGSTYFEHQLKPIERYAVQFLDLWDPIINTSALETQVTFEEREWELEQLEKFKEEQEAEIDEDEEPLFYESWDTSFADEAYRQQVEVLTQQQEIQLQSELQAMVEEVDDDRDPENFQTPNKKLKKKKFKSLGKGSLEIEYNHFSEEDALETCNGDYVDELLSSASDDGEYGMHFPVPLRTPSQRKRKAPRLLEDEILLESESKKFKRELDGTRQEADSCGITGIKPRFGGKLSIMTTLKKGPMMILERQKKKESSKSKGFPPRDPWMPAEDAVLSAVIHEYGGNWHLASDALEGMPDGGVYRGRYRHPLKCRERFRQLLIENATPCGEPSNEKNVSSSYLRVNEDDTKRLLEVVQQAPDNELLLQRHFAAVLRASDCHRSKSGTGQISSVSQPRSLPFVSLANLSQGSLRPPLRLSSSKQGRTLVASALLQANEHDGKGAENSSLRKLTKKSQCSDEIERLEISLSFPNRADFEEFTPVNITIEEHHESKTTESAISSSVLKSSLTLVEDRFRFATQMGWEGTASAAACTGIGTVGALASPTSSHLGKRRPVNDLSKLQKTKSQKVQQKNGMVENEPLIAQGTSVKPGNVKKSKPSTMPAAEAGRGHNLVSAKPSTSLQQSSLMRPTSLQSSFTNNRTLPHQYPFGHYLRLDFPGAATVRSDHSGPDLSLSLRPDVPSKPRSNKE